MQRLILGDCLEELKKLDDYSCDISFTSPPYNRKRNDVYDNYDDSIDDYSGFLINVIDEMLRVTKRNIFFNIQKNFYNKEEVKRQYGHAKMILKKENQLDKKQQRYGKVER